MSLNITDVNVEAFPVVNKEFFDAFVSSLSIIIISELGDKTFFLAAILAMKNSQIIVFLGASSALILMTLLSVFFGWIVAFIPKIYTLYLSVCLFVIFGAKMLHEGYYMETSADAQMQEVENELLDKAVKENNPERKQTKKSKDNGDTKKLKQKETKEPKEAAEPTSCLNTGILKSTLFAHAFLMTFLAEWGDRSQFGTIVLSARKNFYGVVFGGVLGHMFCTCLAVVGGRLAAEKISPRSITLFGGVVFLIFAVNFCFDQDVYEKND